jgi:diguanylate cyclase (GGDEF)-like protein
MLYPRRFARYLRELTRPFRTRMADILAPEAAEQRDTALREAQYDGLTGLADNRAFVRARPAADSDDTLWFIYIDFIALGKINNRYTHDAGDALLMTLAQIILAVAEEFGTNRVFRRGGDEFAIIANAEVVQEICVEIRVRVRARLSNNEPLLDTQGQPYPTRYFRRHGVRCTVAPTAHAADVALIRAKKSGRGRPRPKASRRARY